MQSSQFGVQGEPQHGGVNLGWGSESSRGKREKLLDFAVKLGGSRKQAVVSASGRRRYAVGHFALHHDYQRGEIFAKFEQAQQDIGGDVVGKISHHANLFGRKRQSGAGRSRLGAKQSVKVDSKNVAFDYFHIGSVAKLDAQLGSEHGLELNGHDPSCTVG